MFRMFCPALLAFALIGPQTGGAQTVAETDASLDMLYGEHAAYRAFFDKLKAAVAADDRTTVAGMVSYPLETRIGGKRVKLRDPAHFIASYGQIMTARVKQALAKQDYADLFANAEGLMIGDGEIWFSGIGGGTPATVRITAVNQ